MYFSCDTYAELTASGTVSMTSNQMQTNKNMRKSAMRLTTHKTDNKPTVL